MNPPALETRGLTKRFDRPAVVDDLTFQVPVGSVCGLLGNNGAGKTTTIRMLMGHLHPTAGAASVFGIDPRQHDEAALRRVAYVSESIALPFWMSVEGAVRMNAALFPAWDGTLAARLRDDFELPRKGVFGFLSHGQKRKLMILLSLCQGADLLIFDEPTIGLDVESRRRFLDCLLDVALAGNRTVLLSSHILSDLERVVDRIVVVQKGRLLVEGDLEDLKARMRRLIVPVPTPKSLFEEHFRVHRCETTAEGETVVTVLDFDNERWERLVSALGLAPGRLVQTVGFNLEELYLELTRSTAEPPRRRSERVLA